MTPAETLRTEGFCVLPASDDEFLRGVDRVAEFFRSTREGSTGKFFFNRDGVPRHHYLLQRRPDPVREFLNSPAVRRKIAQLRGEPVYVSLCRISFKKPGERVPWLAHQDNGYKWMSGHPVTDGFACAVFLEDVTGTMGPLCLLPRTHLNGTVAHERVVENDRLDYQVRVADMPAVEPVELTGPKGTIAVFHQDTIHYSGNNQGPSWRPLLIFECEPYRRYRRQEGRVPIVYNDHLSVADRAMTWTAGLPRRVLLRLKDLPWLHRAYRRLTMSAR